jgi:hypothetical protein
MTFTTVFLQYNYETRMSKNGLALAFVEAKATVMSESPYHPYQIILPS